MPDDTEIIALFSSDAHVLYKADVYRALSLPTDYTLQFRYKKDYIHQDILTKLHGGTDGLVGQDGCIFFVSGNDLQKKPEERVLTLHSIRKVKIVNVYDDSITEQVYFILQMKEFIDYRIHDDVDARYLPQSGKFVSSIIVRKGIKNSWINRIDEVKESFQEQLFFNIGDITEKSRSVNPTYSSEEKASFYKLKDESTNQVQLNLYDLRSGKSILKSGGASDALTLHISENYSVNAPLDRQVFTLSSGSLSREKEVKFIRLGEANTFNDYNVDLKFIVERGSWKQWTFGALTGLAAIGLLGTQLVSKKSSELSELIAWWNCLIGILALVSIFFSSSYLFKLFNKK